MSSADMSVKCSHKCLLQKLLERVQEVLARHYGAEDGSPDIGVHSLLTGEVQHLGANLEGGVAEAPARRRLGGG